MSEWTVILLPAGRSTLINGRVPDPSGIAVMLTDGDVRHEVSRVAFSRQDSRNPDTVFTAQLTIELGKANQAAEVMNELDDQEERERTIARRERVERVKKEVRAILGAQARSRKPA